MIFSAAADKKLLYQPPDIEHSHEHVHEIIPILTDERYHENGHYSVDVETGNGIVMSEAGQPVGENGSVHSQGEYS